MYKERKVEEGKYKYLVECSVCSTERWVSNAKASRCRRCAGTQSYTPHTKPRKDARKRGDGYITKQGYLLVFKDGGYVPAHRLLFPNIPKDYVVHHVDGDKLNNKVSNLYPCSKAEHRETHGRLEKLSYLLVQAGLISFKDGDYSFGEELKQLTEKLKDDQITKRSLRKPYGRGPLSSESCESFLR